MSRKEDVEIQISNSLCKLDSFVRSEKFQGYDPYDALASRLPLQLLGTKLAYYLTQLNKRDPFGVLRTVLFVPKQHVPKALALFLESYVLWSELELENRDHEKEILIRELFKLRSPEYGEKYCWGLNYPYATSLKFVPSLQPSLVVTAYAHRAMEALLNSEFDSGLLPKMESGIRFLIEDLPRTEKNGEICFSYYPSQKDIVYNANAKAAEMLARMYSLTGNEKYRDLALKSMAFTVSHQLEDGRWNYRMHEGGTERKQVDFHQLDILESLSRFIRFIDPADSRYVDSMNAGIDFFVNNQLRKDGTVHYRWPKYWPIDIHNQASSIVTLTNLSKHRPELLKLATITALKTINDFQNSNGGFSFRKSKYLKNKANYIRWSNAWMHLALTTVLQKIRD